MKKKKILAICFIIVLIFAILGQSIYAANVDWDRLNDTTANGSTANTVYSVMGAVINITTIAGAGIAIIMLIWLAIKYINTYTPADKSDIKKQLPVYVTGAIILFSASALLKIVYSFVTENINKAV